MKLINTLAVLTFLASTAVSADTNKNVKAIPDIVISICEQHQSPENCYGYVIASVKMAMIAGSIDGMCKIVGNDVSADSKKNCIDARSNVRFIEGIANENK